MTRVRREPLAIAIEFEEHEAGLLADVARQLRELVASGSADDPAMSRLLPDAYPDDPAASEEFRRYTASDLADGKAERAGRVEAALEAADGGADGGRREVRLDEEAATTWIRTLTDARLVLAERLGIRSDDDAVPDDMPGAVYQWLGDLQWRLVDAIDELDEQGRDGEGPSWRSS